MDRAEGHPTSPERPAAPVRRGFRLWGLVLFAAAFALAVLILDRRGARIAAPPPPSAAPEAPSLPELPPSTVSMSVHVDVGLLERALEGRLPSSFGGREERRVHPGDPWIS